MKLLTQTDIRWAAKKLGKTNYTIGGSGCLITAICNCINIVKGREVITPDDLNIKLYQSSGYDVNGLLIWNAAAKILDCKFDPYYDGPLYSDSQYIAKIKDNHFVNILAVVGSNAVIYDVYWDEVSVLPLSDMQRIIYVKVL